MILTLVLWFRTHMVFAEAWKVEAGIIGTKLPACASLDMLALALVRFVLWSVGGSR